MTIRTTSIGLATLVAMSVYGAAFAQSASDTDLTAQVRAQAEPEIEITEVPETLSDLVAGLDGKGVAIPLTGIPEDAEIETRTLSELDMSGGGGNNVSALDNALSRAQTRLDMLQTQIDGSDAVIGAIEARGFTSDDVIGIYQTAKRSLTVLLDDRA
ncbi:hypothetical protein CSE45_2945 [Citreicella sp. SE45]|nr:hypothetical protein CSE45_2945 [Citreicella sp. SE45]